MNNSLDSELPFAAGTLIDNRYEIVGELSKGDQGTVYEVRDQALNNETIALKVLYPHLIADAALLARLGHELQFARRLGHPNIVSVFDAGVADDRFPYVTMELFHGESLAERLRQGPLPLEDILHILVQVCHGLSAAHQMGIVHRDLRPAHILLDSEDNVKIGGFYLARRFPLEAGLDGEDWIKQIHAEYYKAPEQFQSAIVDPRVDIYALGIIAFEMLSGEKPFVSTDSVRLAEMHFSEPLPKLAPLRHDVPPWLEKLVQKCANKNPDQRCPGADAVLSVLYENAPEFFSEATQLSNFVLARSVSPPVPFLSHFAWLSRFLALAVLCGIVFLAVRTAWYQSVPMEEKHVAVEEEPPLLEPKSAGSPSPNLADQDGITPLMRASEKGDIDMLSVLLVQGVKLDEQDNKGWTALIYAAGQGQLTTAEKLLASGAAVDARDKNGAAALHHAAARGALDVASLLLKHGADINAVDNDGQTALIYAVKRHNPALITLLLDNKARLDIYDKDARSVFFYADKDELRQLSNRAVAKSDPESKVKRVGLPTTPNQPQLNYPKRTRLRAGVPRGVWEERGPAGAVLLSCKVEVLNAGETDAHDVKVSVVTPLGQIVDLPGPETLPKNSRAEYSNENIEVFAPTKGRLSVRSDCANCRK